MIGCGGDMVEGIEGVGEAITGGLAARALEPKAGEAAGHGTACLNCGTALSSKFCPECGQAAHVHRTLGAFWHDLAHSVLHFEGKIWRTLPSLVWRPGELTRRYIEGERARFVSPIALFLFSVFLTFAVISALGTRAYADRNGEKLATAEGKRETDQGLGRGDADIKTGVVISDSFIKLDDTSPTNVGWFNEAYRKAKANPSLLIYKIQSNAYKFSWALIPISVPFVWLLFLHRRRYRRYKIYDHTVFVTYSLAFMSLAAVVYTFLKLAGLNGTIALLPFLVVPVHMYRQLRGAYQLARWSAFWRAAMLLLFAAAASSLFMLLLLGLGVLG